MKLFLALCPIFLSTIPVPRSAETIEEPFSPTSSATFEASLPEDYQTDSMIIRVKDERKDYSLRDFSDIGGKSVREIYHHNNKKVLVVKTSPLSKAKVVEHIDRLLKREDVLYAEPNMEGEWFSTTPEETGSDFGNGFGYLAYLKMDKAWDIAKSTNVTVGVIDTGVKESHIDLNGRINTSLSYTTTSLGPYNSPVVPHGTAVAGVIGAIGNNLTSSGNTAAEAAGICYGGVNIAMIRADDYACFDPNVSVSPYATEISGSMVSTDVAYYGQSNHETVATIVPAIRYAIQQNFSIVNFSGGFQGVPSQALKDAVDDYSGLLVCAAGNEGTDFDNCAPDKKVYPACYPNDNILTVAASASASSPLSDSNKGSVDCDIFAPGFDIKTTSFDDWTPKVKLFSGTSMAAPIVTGIAALLKGYKPSLTPVEIKNIITSTATLNAGFSDCSSGGQINAYKALLEACPEVTAGTNVSSSAPLHTLSPYSSQWFRVQANPGYYDLQTTGNYNTSGTLFDSDGESVIATSSSGGSGNNFKMQLTFSTSKTCYLRVDNLGSYVGDMALSISPTHFHDYTSSYSWYSPTKHRAFCECGSYSLQGHTVTSTNLHHCIICGGYASSGFINESIGNSVNNTGLLQVGTDSYLTSDGILILGPQDLILFQSGLITYDEIVGGL